jgi:hypothetical protein
MAMFHFSVKHGRSLDDASAKLRTVVDEAQAKMGRMINQVNWAPDGHSVKLVGTGFNFDLRVDAEQVHVEGDITLLGNLFGGKIAEGLKRIIGDRFKQLPK